MTKATAGWRSTFFRVCDVRPTLILNKPSSYKYQKQAAYGRQLAPTVAKTKILASLKKASREFVCTRSSRVKGIKRCSHSCARDSCHRYMPGHFYAHLVRRPDNSVLGPNPRIVDVLMLGTGLSASYVDGVIDPVRSFNEGRLLS
jgi:hypothetical protein